MKALERYQIILLGEQRHIGVNNLPKVVARQCSGQESNPRSAHRKSSALTTTPLNHPRHSYAHITMSLPSFSKTISTHECNFMYGILYRGHSGEDSGKKMRYFGHAVRTDKHCLPHTAFYGRVQGNRARWLGGVMVTASDLRSTGSRVRLRAVPLPSSNRGPVALCTLGLGLLNPPS